MNQGGTSVALTSDGSTISAKVTPTLDSRPVPTGTGTFLEGSTVLSSNALANGSTSFDAGGLSAGAHTITFQYSGDENFQPNTASSNITTAGPPDFAISSSSPSLTVTRGQTATVKLTVTANAGLSGMVTFACSGLPAESTCTFSPASVMVTAGRASTATLSISTTAAASTLKHPAELTTTARMAATLMLLFVIPLCGGRRPGFNLSVVVGVLSLAGTLLLGCGGNSNAQSSTGSYTVKVTATSGTGNAAITHILPLTVTIQ
jgi:Bacterial Ig-like domain (group 3)